MKRLKTLLLSVIPTGLIVASFQNCGDVRLQNVPPNSEPLMPNLRPSIMKTLEPDQVTTQIRHLFIVDSSGSNYLPDTSVTPIIPASDSDRTRRFLPIRNYVDAVRTAGPMFWSLIRFSDEASFLPLGRKFTDSREAFVTNSVNYALQTSIDGGNTSYLKALELLHRTLEDTAVSESALNPPKASNYQIYFVTDGAPGKMEDRVGGAVFVPESRTSIEGKMRELMGLRDRFRISIDGIQLHTGLYYGGNSPPADAESLLRNMAGLGEGRFLIFGPGQSLNFSNFSGLTRTMRFQYRDLWITNMSAVWEQGRFVSDSDGDGLSDLRESQIGSDPQEKDSDQNGASDGVELRVFGSPCGDPRCSPADARELLQCSGASTTQVDTDGDLLSDCEERLLGSSPFLWDTNGQGLPDALAFRNGISMTNPASIYLDPDLDGVSTYSEIKRSLPPNTPNSQLHSQIQTDVQIQQVGIDGDSEVYQITYRSLPYLRSTDNIVLFWIEETRNVIGKRFLRVRRLEEAGGLSIMGSQ